MALCVFCMEARLCLSSEDPQRNTTCEMYKEYRLDTTTRKVSLLERVMEDHACGDISAVGSSIGEWEQALGRLIDVWHQGSRAVLFDRVLKQIRRPSRI